MGHWMLSKVKTQGFVTVHGGAPALAHHSMTDGTTTSQLHTHDLINQHPNL
jgi:hypothetical protein